MVAPSTASDDAELIDQGWALHGNDWGEQRHSTLDQVDRDNVDKLGLAWYFDMYTQRGVEATPLVALAAESGEVIWDVQTTDRDKSIPSRVHRASPKTK